ncbi:hypothetical protein PR202_ga31441 [Eleusine coracana subsp. coracana]|uniref:BHLH domain-containing protein n=1 Tax=Eleusine coracana subsp. coracana TaxID=191504 RepID=A0AAV5DS83_ELECO|nr:hypothetical protein PR202_ga31441 [Eleusine coracana subsp. coracana]
MAEKRHPLLLEVPLSTEEGKRSPGTASGKRKAVPETERARRRTMSGLYAELAALLPGLPARATRTRIVEEAVAQVGALRAAAADLEAHSRAARTTTADDGGGAVAVSAEASCFAVRLPAARRPGSLARVLEVFQRHGVAVLAATVTSSGGEAAVTVTTSAVAPAAAERIKADIGSSIVA